MPSRCQLGSGGRYGTDFDPACRIYFRGKAGALDKWPIRVLLSAPVNSTCRLAMNPKFSEDVVPLSDMKVNPGRVVKHSVEAHRPVLLTSRGRGVAVMQSLDDYETENEERAFMRAVIQGLVELEQKQEISLAEVKKRLSLK